MLTALLILALVVVVLGGVTLTVAAFRGCFFSSLWLYCGGLKNVGAVVLALLDLIGRINGND